MNQTSLYFLAHPTDSILGRTGSTFDWERSLPNGLPESWESYPQPPIPSDWRYYLPQSPQIVARNAVRPFALLHLSESNLVMLSQAATTLFGSSASEAFVDQRAGHIRFGKRTMPYEFAGLRYPNVESGQIKWETSRFARVRSDQYHIHGTSIGRGQEGPEQCPDPIEADMAFPNRASFHASWRTLTRILPMSLIVDMDALPAALGFGLDLYVRLDYALPLASIKDVGMSFPYKGVQVRLGTNLA